MTIARHPDDLTLMGFAAGSLAEPLAAVVAAHLDLCPRCRAEVGDLERMGAALMGAAGPAGGTPGVRARARSLPRAASEDGSRMAIHGDDRIGPADLLPRPIRRRWGVSLADIRWYPLARGVRHHRLPLSPGVTGDLRLLEVAGGAALPEHGHYGGELTLVLRGGFSDATGRFGPGDVEDVDAEVEHRPVADPEGCICLVGSEGPVRFTGLGMRLWQIIRRQG